ncbi:kinase-like domain-containing protein [Rhizophagus diaphanus]|nr:kinase-like domain-containing protein [Rhizophagus diaphanus] [Rhizophagus sp. MUCL 43196]
MPRLEEREPNSIDVFLDDKIINYYYDSQEFNNFSKIGSGGFSAVHAAYWKNTTKFAIKKFNENGGTLERHLRNITKTLIKWEIQFKFAREITASKKRINTSKYNKVITLTKSRGVIPYVDPKILDVKGYDLNEKSDKYSLGVIFWELTSCSSPFNYNTSIILKILSGEREKPIPNTNDKFVALYEKCWRQEQDERPDIHKVNSELDKINFTDLKVNISLSNNFKESETTKMMILTYQTYQTYQVAMIVT